jgi:DNA ligase D-like protein (predicted 3'-phosphoesterase)
MRFAIRRTSSPAEKRSAAGQLASEVPGLLLVDRLAENCQNQLGGHLGATPLQAAPGGDSLEKLFELHHARRLHWDLRLERDGVLVSWALPRGVPEDRRHNHLAVHVEDHPLEYGDFEGEIPKGQYGAGKVTIWARGTYQTHKWNMSGPKAEVMVTFHGERLKGRYVLFRQTATG